MNQNLKGDETSSSSITDLHSSLLKHLTHYNPFLTEQGGCEHTEAFILPESLCISKIAFTAGFQSCMTNFCLGMYFSSIPHLTGMPYLSQSYIATARSQCLNLDSAHIVLLDGHTINIALKVSCAVLSCLESPSFPQQEAAVCCLLT